MPASSAINVAPRLGEAAVAAVDSSAQTEAILGLPGHVRDAVARVAHLRPAARRRPRASSWPAMGASAVGARLAIAVLGDRARRPIVVADGYGVPPWTTAADIVLCCSYSGATEETPACYEDARNRGATLVVATTGGRLGERARCDGVPVIAGEGLTAPVAYRWKCQLNENAKVAAFWSVLPEADHNEVCGWGGCGEVGPFAGVFLEDPAGHARVARRTALTAALARADGVVVERVRARGDNCADRVLSLVLLGDLVSVYLAVLRGADPGDISAIDRLKASLS